MGGGMPQLRATVRWESAAPVMAAYKREIPENWKDKYLISVSGLPMMGRRNPENPGPSKALLTRLKDATELQRKGKDPIGASDVVMAEDGMRVVYVFLRGSQPIEAADKEVVFSTKIGPIAIKTKFTLKDMVYDGKLAL